MYTDSTGTLVCGNFYIQEMTMYTDSTSSLVCGNIYIQESPVYKSYHKLDYQWNLYT
jgi:hypothetical protein